MREATYKHLQSQILYLTIWALLPFSSQCLGS